MVNGVSSNWTGDAHQLSFVSLVVDDRQHVPVGHDLRVGGDLERALHRRPLAFEGGEALEPVGVRLRRDRVGDVAARLRRVGHQLLGGVEALVVDQVVAIDVPADVGPVATGLQHGQVHEPAVGGAECPTIGLTGMWAGASSVGRGRSISNNSDVLTDERGGPHTHRQQRHVDDARSSRPFALEQCRGDATGDRHPPDRVAVRPGRL